MRGGDDVGCRELKQEDCNNDDNCLWDEDDNFCHDKNPAYLNNNTE